MRARLAVLLIALLVSGAGGSQALAQDDASAVIVDDPRLPESSALAVSPADDDLLYTVNDSGNDPVVYVVDRFEAAIVGTTLLAGVDTETADPEAVGVDRANTLWVADIGDNLRSRDDIALYALPAPVPGEVTVTPQRYPLRYPGDAADAEAFLVDPVGGQRWVVTKGLLSGSVLAVPDRLAEGADNTLVPVPDVVVPGRVTDGTVLPDGDGAVLRTYGRAYVYALPDWELVDDFALPRQQQGESLTVLPGGTELLAGSEGSPSRIASVELPETALRALSGEPTEAPTDAMPPEPSGSPAAGEPDPGDGLPTGWLVAIGAGTAVVGAVGVLLALPLGRRRP